MEPIYHGSFMRVGIPVESELKALLRLLDDETPEVRARVAERLLATTGDLSEPLAELGWHGSDYERELLSGFESEAKQIRPLRVVGAIPV